MSGEVDMVLDFDDTESSGSSQTSEFENEMLHPSNLGHIALTPFDMTEELEEGYFDGEGMYHWKKEPKTRDNWLDSIDSVWVKSEHVQTNHKSTSNISVVSVCNYKEVYEKILRYLKPKETVAQALSRLGKDSTLTATERWKCKKLGTFVNSNNSEKIMDLTGLANKVLAETGDFDIYQKNYEDIFKQLQETIADDCKGDSVYGFNADKSPELDMFCDDFEEKERTLLKELAYN